jgi:hypothetical protein
MGWNSNTIVIADQNKQMTKSFDHQTNQTMLPDSDDVCGYIFKQAFNA